MSKKNWRNIPLAAKCSLASFALIIILFGDVVFRGASLAPLDYAQALLPAKATPPPVSWYPEAKGRKISDSWGDLGAAAWQYQPALRFIAYCMRTGESPWWNPFDATGRMEPESMIDIPFSVVTVTIALLGGGSTAFSFVLLALYFAAVLSLLLTLTRYMEVSFLAGCAASAAYLLNGFALGNLSSQIGQPYFLAPLALLSLFAFAARPDGIRFALAALAQALLFLVTEFPTLVLADLSVFCIVLAYSVGGTRSWKSAARIAFAQCAVPLAGFCLVAFLYFPIFEANLRYLDVIAVYNARPSPGYSLESALSLFTPKHFWQSYLAFRTQPGWPNLRYERWIFHVGVTGSLLGATGFAWFRDRRRIAVALVCGMLIAIAVGQMFSIPPFTLIDRLAFFKFVRNEYWPALAGIPIALLVALGLDSQGKRGFLSFAIGAASISASFGYLFIRLGLPTQQPERGQVFIFLAVFGLASLGIVLLQLRVSFVRQVRWALACSVLLEGIYYMNNLHPVRSHREEQLPESIAWVKHQISSPAGDRVLNIGGTGMMPDWGGGIQVPEIGAVESSIVPQYKDFFKGQIGRGIFLSFYDTLSTYKFTRESLSAACVRFVIVDRSFKEAIARLEQLGLRQVREDSVRIIFQNPAPTPRAYLTALLSLTLTPSLPSNGGATTTDPALMRAARRAGMNDERSATTGAGNATVEEYHHTKLRIRTASRIPAVLVIRDSCHPNWKARVDGVDAYVGCVNIAFRGIAVPAGSHIVEMTYEPRTLRIGSIVSFAALILIFGLPFVQASRLFTRGDRVRS